MYVMGALDEDGGDSSIYVVHQRKVESGSDGGITTNTADIPSNGKMPYDIKGLVCQVGDPGKHQDW